jgi:hypothetical protein
VSWEASLLYAQTFATTHHTGHLPPCLDEFGAQGQWDEKYVPDYLEIVAQYADVIKGHLFGHVHASGLRAFPDDRVQTPLVTASAVSPIYNNYPTYFVASYSRKSGLYKGLGILSTWDSCLHF